MRLLFLAVAILPILLSSCGGSPGGEPQRSAAAASAAPVAVTAAADGDMWFSDEGTRPAIGRITPSGRIREFTAGLEDGSEPAQLVSAPDGDLWFSDEGSLAAVGRVDVGALAAVVAPPSVTQAADRLSCHAGRWASWDDVGPSASLLGFDGYGWLRRGITIVGRRGPLLQASGRDLGSPLACEMTVTYPPPLLVSVRATSAAVTLTPPG